MTASIHSAHLPITPRSSPSSKPTTNSNFPITNLPTDILLTLFRLISSPQTLSALSLCSRQFHHYITPYLYSHFLHLGDTCTSLPHFLHTILHNPHYALYTKIFTCNALLGYKTDISISNFSPSDLVLLKSCLKSIYTLEDGSRSPFFGSHIASQWYNFILQGNWDAIVGLILCLLPNLQSLNIINHASGCPYGYPYLETVLNRAANLQNQRLRDPTRIFQPQAYSFPHLRSLHLAKHDTIHYPRMGFEILRALPFLAIPSIREVNTHMLSDYHFPFSVLPSSLSSPSPTQQAQTPPPITPFTLSTFYSPPLPNFTFHVTHLHLSHTVLRQDSLVPFFSYFKFLKSLQWEWDYDTQIGKREGLEFSFDINHFLHSIAHLRDILEVLRLRVSESSSSSSSSSSADTHDGSEDEDEEDEREENEYQQQQKHHSYNNESDEYHSIITQLSHFSKLEVLSLSANLLPAPKSASQISSSDSDANSSMVSDESEHELEDQHDSLPLPKCKSPPHPNIDLHIATSQNPRGEGEVKHLIPSPSPTLTFNSPQPNSTRSHKKVKRSSSPPCETCIHHASRARETQVRARRMMQWMRYSGGEEAGREGESVGTD
ncbi:uncharacterized protein Bfra_001542 [Botrytis fragariae]|uniref:F-box domain-containing protein n=1 Tax=Botrytis fragariae TaxID=1964551 RepID=A0A8H6B0K7_9HELO|nr:uncharacterized protein Bfra_001542 [Botrytis fragariae]KAF5877179.1 hypothetical protein Bfra_001542 [Botrytis fragariae]